MTNEPYDVKEDINWLNHLIENCDDAIVRLEKKIMNVKKEKDQYQKELFETRCEDGSRS